MEILNLLANWAQILALPLTIIVAAITVWYTRRGQQKRAISCTFDSVASPVEVKAGEALKGDIEIRYKGKPVENLFVVRAHLRNTGNSSIRKSDVLEPIKFTFAENAELIRQPIVVDRIPKELNFDWQFGMIGNPPRVNSTSLIFDLLNPRDELTVEFICTGKSEIPKLTARIEGVSQVDTISPYEVYLLKHNLFTIWGMVYAIIMVACILAIAAIIIYGFRSSELPFLLLSIAMFIFGVYMLWEGILKPTIDLLRLRRHKRKG